MARASRAGTDKIVPVKGEIGIHMGFVVEVLKKEAEEVVHLGEFEAQYLAVACAKRAIDAFLLREYQDGMTPDQLFKHYMTRGEYPCIFRDGANTLNVPFSHLKYAMGRCDEVCGNAEESVRQSRGDTAA